MSDPQAQGLASLRATLLGDRGALMAVFAVSLFINVLGLTTSIYMLQIYDRVLASYSVDTLIFLTAIAVFSLMTMSALEAVRGGMLQRAGARFADKLGPQALEAQLGGVTRPEGPALQPLRDLDTLRSVISSPFVAAAFDVPWSFIFFALVYWLHPLLFAITAVFAVLLIVVAVLNERLNAKPSAAAAKQQLEALQFAESASRAGETLIAMGAAKAVTARWHANARRAAVTALGAQDRASAMHALARFLRWVLQILLLGGGAGLAIAGDISAGGLIMSSILGARAVAPIEALIGGWRATLSARQALERLAPVFGKRAAASDGVTLPRPTGKVASDRASVMIPGAQRLLFANVSFSLAPGEQMAIIGPSGSGKSTLARAILGLVPLAAGSIRLDGAEVSVWRKQDLGRWIGYLPQAPTPVVGTVGENIARFETGDDADVIAAAKAAGVHDLILSFPNGYDTPLGAGGVRLSGGQLQWVAIASALYGGPSLLVLDEPESHLDGDGETQLRQLLVRLREHQATVIIVSHRPSVVGAVDKLLILRDGKAEFGAREELMKKSLRVSGGSPRQISVEDVNGKSGA